MNQVARFSVIPNSVADTTIPEVYLNNCYISVAGDLSITNSFDVMLELVSYMPSGIVDNPLMNLGAFFTSDPDLIQRIKQGKSFYEKDINKIIKTVSYGRNAPQTISTKVEYKTEKSPFLKKNPLGPKFYTKPVSEIYAPDNSKNIQNSRSTSYSANVIMPQAIKYFFDMHVIFFHYLQQKQYVTSTVKEDTLPPVGEIILGPVKMERITVPYTSDFGASTEIDKALANPGIVDRYLLSTTEGEYFYPQDLPNTGTKYDIWAGPYHRHPNKLDSAQEPKVMSGLFHTEQTHPALSKVKVPVGINKVSFVESLETVDEQIQNIQYILTSNENPEVLTESQKGVQKSFSFNQAKANFLNKILALSAPKTISLGVEFPRSSRSSLVPTAGNFSDKPTVAVPTSTGAVGTVLNKQIQPTAFDVSSQVTKTSTGLQRMGISRSNLVRKNQKIKNTSDTYASLHENGNISLMFAVDKINILKNYSPFAGIIDELSTENLNKVFENTKLSNISVTRKSKYATSVVEEAVLDTAALQRDSLGEKLLYVTDRFFKSKDKNESCMFEVHRNIFSNAQERTIFYSLTDYRKDSTIRDKVYYEFDMDFEDGLKKLIAEKFSIFNTNLAMLKRLHSFLASKGMQTAKLKSNIKYGLVEIVKLPAKTVATLLGLDPTQTTNLDTGSVDVLAAKINLAIASYLDLANLMLPAQNKRLDLAHSELQRDINIYTGSFAKLEKHIKNFEKLQNLIRTKLDQNVSEDLATVENPKRKAFKNIKNKISFSFKSKEIALINENKNPLGYLSYFAKQDIKEYPKIPKQSVSIALAQINKSVLVPTYTAPDFNYFDMSAMKSYESLVLLDNQKKGIANLGVQREYAIVDDKYTNSELLSNDRVLDALTSHGVHITEIDNSEYSSETSNLDFSSVTKKISPIIRQSSTILGSTNLFNNVATPETISLTETQMAIKNNQVLDFNEEMGYIAANLIVGDLQNKNKNKISELNLSEYTINNCLNKKMQYLSGFQISSDNVNLFKENWVSINPSDNTDIANRNLLCRLYDFDLNELQINIRKDLDVLSLYDYFVLSNSTITAFRANSRQRAMSIQMMPGLLFAEEYMNIDPEVISTMSGLDGLLQGARAFIYINKLFSHQYFFDQPKSVKAYGTNFNNMSKKPKMITSEQVPQISRQSANVPVSSVAARTTAIGSIGQAVSPMAANMQNRTSNTGGSY